MSENCKACKYLKKYGEHGEYMNMCILNNSQVCTNKEPRCEFYKMKDLRTFWEKVMDLFKREES